MNNKPTIILLMGPTASGKTQLAIDLVRKLPCDIISVDSAMVYRGMDIGTAKPTQSELSIAPHRLINICDPTDVYSAGKFRDDALIEINKILKQDRIPLLVGGTMMYFNALVNGLSNLPAADEKIRMLLTKQAEQIGWPTMHEKLMAIDPKCAAQIHPNDAQRIQRALEVFEITGESISVLQQQNKTDLPFNFVSIALAPQERSILHSRIEQRFDKMLDQGFLEEVKSLHDRSDLHADLPSIRTVGYRQAWNYLNDESDYQQMRDKAIAASRQLAKRQLTWLRSWSNVQWFDSLDSNLATRVCKIIN